MKTLIKKEMLLLAVSFIGMNYANGQKIANINQPLPSPTFVNIYWDNTWDADNPQLKVATLNLVTQAIAKGPYFQGLAEYGVQSGSFAGGLLPDPNCASKPLAKVGFWDPFGVSISGFIQCEHDFGPPVLRQNDVVYNVILPGYSIESDGGQPNFCNGPGSTAAFHYHGLKNNFFNGQPMYTITMANAQCGDLFHSLSHEMVEAATDPYPFDISVFPFHIDVAGENEIADFCNGDITITVNGQPFNVTTYWSNFKQQCVPDMTPTFGGAVLWDTDTAFSDGNGWNHSEYANTMMFADINGDGKADVCGRGVQGIYCELSTGNGFGAAFLASNDFSDAEGWNNVIYYGSLRLADVNGDGAPDICGRGIAGVYCALNNGNGTFGGAMLWDSFFADQSGWGLPQYGTTMMFADINGDGKADLCGRGSSGIWCELSTGAGFGPAVLVQDQFSDANGWDQIVYYGSLRFADVNGDGTPDICGRGIAGVLCALGNGNATFSSLTQWDSFFSDGNGWNHPEFATTMMFADINGDGKTDVCGRGSSGIWCELSVGPDTGFGTQFLAQPDFSDANGWNLPIYYGSLRLADLNGDGKPDICGRGSSGIYCALNGK